MFASASDSYFNFSSLNGIKNLNQKDSKAALKQVASQFETIFMKMMIKSMRDASFGNPLFHSDSAKLYRDMYDDQLALNLSKAGGVGIADMLVKQLGKYLPDENKKIVKPDELPMLKAAMNSVKSSQSVKQNSFKGPRDFVKTLWPSAVNAAKQIGVSPKVLIAQAALETGWGKYMIRLPDGELSHNLFNIKADQRWNGKTSAISTVEYLGGKASTQQANFRAYDSYLDSFNDYIAFLKQSPRYQKALNVAGNDKAYAESLQQAGFATDPNYAKKIQRILNDKPLNNALADLNLAQN